MSDRDHDSERPATASSEQDVDSAATTLRPSASSSRNGSLEKGRKYADIGLEQYRTGQQTSRKGSHGDDSAYSSEGERHDDGHANEHEHLLALERAALDASTEAAETTRCIQDDRPSPPLAEPSKEQAVSWSSLPKKSQLAILTLARLSEPLTQTSLQAYMFYQLKSFHGPDQDAPSDATVAKQAGILAAAFTGAQFCTAIMWGRLADSEMFGRKRVILIGLVGTAAGSLGFGFSSSFRVAVFWRCFGGMLNGNIGVMRTMISEIVKEKRYLSRAFLLLPMTFNIGVIIGPLLGGMLADPVGSYPDIFGPGGSIGGKDGVRWLMRWPYALPNVVNAGFLVLSTLGVVLGLEETLEGLRDKSDYGLRFSRWVLRNFFRRSPSQQYEAVPTKDGGNDDIELSAGHDERAKKPTVKRKLPFRRIWTRNVLCTLLAHGLLAMHVGTFSALWFVFLSTPRYTPDSANNDGDSTTLHLPANYKPYAPFTFTGGLALPPPSIGTALAILGVLGISLQLLLYPRLSFQLGTVASFRYFLPLFPVAYFLAPYLSVIPSTNPPPGQATGPWIWMYITLVLIVQVMARTFALPSTAILVNNASPHPSVLGTIHGIAQSVSSATRTVGPVLFSWIYGVGLSKGVVGTAWWCMCLVAGVGALASWWVREGDGHEIWLEGEEEEAMGAG